MLHANEKLVTVAQVEVVFDILDIDAKEKHEWERLFKDVQFYMTTGEDPQMKTRMVNFFRGFRPYATPEEINTSLVCSDNFTPK